MQSEERINYERRMGDKWVQDLEKFKTDWAKPYLENGMSLVRSRSLSYILFRFSSLSLSRPTLTVGQLQL